MTPIPRRQFLFTGAVGLAGLAFSGRLGAATPPGPSDIGPVPLTPVGPPPVPVAAKASADVADVPSPAAWPAEKRIGFAIVGLGGLAHDQLLPAFSLSKRARIAGLVSGSPEKASAVAGQYGVKQDSVYGYDEWERIAQNPDIDAVYLAVPNSLHAQYTFLAAKAGKHVLCEKPMATSAIEAQQMIDACAQASRKLMVAYRCQYEVFNRALIDLVRQNLLGQVGLIEACNVQSIGNPLQWRLKKALSGGGSLPDLGLYCVNSARAVLGEEPFEVSARVWNPPNDPRFSEVEDTMAFTLRFPGGALVNCSSSYSLHRSQSLRVYGTQGWAELENAFAYRGPRLIVHGKDGTKEITTEPTLEFQNPFALELDHFASCIVRDVKPYTPGEEGLQDHRIMEALYQSARMGRTAALAFPPATRGPAPI
ncbi:Predicted dehydrogenase [Verrucomicrobium sp. GAS474]|uniref:Gfo/Idh/MocA family protein n=1 Tax=Verrucomicrobium sp. GAS474 TaxID=1882831 RepID=UPI00087C6713|nr:Gfo/Idh/MocA family oxidoreductase [Verrucomicrobium sp. GAS474]SDU15537.1 Predicted dehydrogenase [Verrucomicrobium sp. GAS474]